MAKITRVYFHDALDTGRDIVPPIMLHAAKESIPRTLTNNCTLKDSDANLLFLTLFDDKAEFSFVAADEDGTWSLEDIRFEFEIGMDKIPAAFVNPYMSSVRNFKDRSMRSSFQEADDNRRAAHEKLLAYLGRNLPKDKFTVFGNAPMEITLRHITSIWAEIGLYRPTVKQDAGKAPSPPPPV